jgi:TfoX/Sxy family transcriptional regulator of competence genes
MARPAPGAPPEKVRLYEALIASLPGVERKGAAFPYTSLNGNMFSILSKEGVMGLRLAKADREAFLSDHGASLYTSHGATMPEYVAVPGDLLADTARMQSYVAKSFAYAQTLKSKPTTKPKKV